MAGDGGSTKLAHGRWESTYHCVFRFIGGTGKYANVRCGSHREQ
jgi:hypothetical protein